MAYITKNRPARSYQEIIPYDEPHMTIQVVEIEKESFTGLYSHEGDPIFKTSDFKMGFI